MLDDHSRGRMPMLKRLFVKAGRLGFSGPKYSPGVTFYLFLTGRTQQLRDIVFNSQGRLIMESILETKASTILEFSSGLRGTLFRRPSKRGPGPHGCTICSSRMWPSWWCAIRARTRCSNMATRVTRSTLANSPIGYGCGTDGSCNIQK